MKNVTYGLIVGSLFGSMLTGCSVPTLTDALPDTVSPVDSLRPPVYTDTLSQGIASAMNGNIGAASGYFTSWYAVQRDKKVARQQLENLATLYAGHPVGFAINHTLKVVK